jgi:2-C-methyl-D-erythritol 2,4-cyclodiphosphate synthase
MIRVGQGFDLHPLAEGIPFKLGGIQLDFPKGPVGHSDGDVLLHALIDALLGAAGLGDIGEWFSPTDATYAGADSQALLATVLKKLPASIINNVDATILLEVPKLGPYKAQIKAHVASLLNIPEAQVNIKAKTMESLGEIGQGNAVAAMVSVLILVS